jgi:hypothetical protein
MTDEFLEILRTEPRPEFAETLWERLSSVAPTNERSTSVTTMTPRLSRPFVLRPVVATVAAIILGAVATLAVSSDARAALREFWHDIAGSTFHEQSTPNIVGLTPPAGIDGQGSTGRPLPTLELGAGGPLPFAEALAVHRANGYKAPSAAIPGYSPEPMASANAGSAQGVSEFRWTDSSGDVVTFDVSVHPEGQSPGISPVGVGSITSTKVNGQPAAYIEGDWSMTSPTGEWDPNALRRVIWYEGNVEYIVAATDRTLGMSDLLRIAESAR